MAKKKVNKKFAIILASSIVGLGIAGALAWRFLRPAQTAEFFHERYVQHVQEGDWINAFEAYVRKVALTPQPTPEMMVTLGDTALRAAALNQELLPQSFLSWRRALEIDPRHGPAVQRLLDFEWQRARIRPDPSMLAEIRRLAETAVAINPEDRRSAAMIPTTTVFGWLRGLEADSARLEADLTAMEQIAREDPGDVDTVITLAQGLARRGVEFRVRGQATQARQSLDRSVAVLDNALAANDQNVELHLRASLVLRDLRRADPENAQAHDARLRAALDRGRQVAQVDDRQFIDINIAAAADMAERGDRAGARAIFERLAETRGGSQQVRLAFADFLSRDRAERGAAIELLSRPIDPAATLGPEVTFGAMVLRQMEYLTLTNLSRLRLDAADELPPDSPDRTTVVREVSATAEQLARDFPDAPAPLVLSGRIHLMEGRAVDAVQALGRARTLIERRPAEERGIDFVEVLLRLAQAYTQTQQTGPATAALRELIALAPDRPQARTMLVELLWREGRTDEALREYAEVRRIAPDDPAVRALDVVLHRAQNRPEDAAAQYAALPERTKEERIRKARVALSLGDFDDAARLFGDAFAEDTGNLEVGVALVQALLAGGRRDDARQVLTTLRQAHAGNVQLAALEARITGTPEDVQRAIEDGIRANPDEFAREMQWYELRMQRGERATALEHLARAATLRPDDRRVLDQQFQQALLDRNFTEAERMLPRLRALNVDQANGNLYQFRLLTAQGRVQDAIAVARDLTRALPQFAQSWLTLAQGLAMAGQFEEALAMFQQALERQGNNVEAIRGVIDANYRLGRPQEALRIVNDAIRRFPNDPTFQEILFNHELTFGDAERALRTREESLRGRENEPAVAAQLAQAFLRVAGARRGRGDLPGARQMSTRAAEALRTVVAAQPGNLETLALFARTAGESENPAAFEPFLRERVTTGPLAESPNSSLLMVDYYVQLNRLEDAERSVREAVQRGGGQVGPRRAAAMLLSQLGKTDDAIAMLDGADNAANDLVLQRQRAEILIQARRFDQAEAAVRAMLARNPADPDVMNLLTIVYVNAGQWEQARRNIVETLVRQGNNLTALYYRALIEVRTGGDLTAAVRDLQFVRDNFPGGAMPTDMRMLLVDALVRANNMDGAIREMRDTLRQDPGNKVVRLQLVDLLMRATPPRPDDALTHIDEGLRLPELVGDPDLMIVKARILSTRGDMEQAVAIARQAVINSNRAAGIFRGYLETLLAANQGRLVIDETDAVLAVQNQAVPFWIRVQRGQARMALQDRDGAVSEFAHAIDLATAANDEEAISLTVGVMSNVLGAEEAIRAIAPRLDQDPRWRLMTSLLEQTRGRLVESLAVLEPVLADAARLEPGMRARVQRTAAMLLVSPGPQTNYDRAAELYRQVLLQFPTDVFTLNNLAYLLTERVSTPNHAEALSYAQRAVAELRRVGAYEPLIFDTYGWSLVLNGRLAEGINILNEAVSRRSFLEGHFHLGSAYLKAGQAREAIEHLTRARAMAEARGADPRYKPRIERAMEEAQALVRRQQEAGGR